MSILLVPVRYAPHVGGIETLLHHTLPRLREQGHEVVIVTGVDDDRASSVVIDGVPVYRLPFLGALRAYDPVGILEISRRLRDIEADHDVRLRHVHGLDFNMFFVARRHRHAPLPLVITAHGTLDMPFPWSPITLQMLDQADMVTAVSNAVRESLVATVPTLAGRVQVIPNAIPSPGDPLPWPANGRLFCAGRLDEQKGFDVVIDALARLSRRWPDLHLDIAGKGTEETTLRAHAEHMGVAARVRLLGMISQDEVSEAIDDASFVLVPSRSIEGFSMIALEAAHRARPVFASAVGGLAETVEDGLTGVLVPPDDPDHLAAAIDDLMTDPARAARMGEEARRRAARFDVDHCADAYAQMYRALGYHPAISVAGTPRSELTGETVRA